MHKFFSDWYRETELDPDAEVLERRWQGVGALREALDDHSCARLARLAYGRPVNDDAKDQFRQPFREADASFPMRGNDRELGVLAAATIISSLEESVDASTHLSLIVRTCDLAGHTPVLGDLAEAAAEYIATQGQRLRQVATQGLPGSIDPEKIVEAFQAIAAKPPNQNAAEELKAAGEALKKTITGINTSLKRSFDYARRLASVQQEQTDVLWWLFGQRAGARAQGITEQALPVVVGFSMAEQLTRWPPPPSHEAFIERALVDSDVDPLGTVTIVDAVDAVPDRRPSLLTNTVPDHLAGLLPLHSAFELVEDFSGQWAHAMTQRTGVDVEVARTNSAVAQLALCEAGVVATSRST